MAGRALFMPQPALGEGGHPFVFQAVAHVLDIDAEVGQAGEGGGARIDVIPDAGHFPHWEQPEEFVQRLSAFVDGRND